MSSRQQIGGKFVTRGGSTLTDGHACIKMDERCQIRATRDVSILLSSRVFVVKLVMPKIIAVEPGYACICIIQDSYN